MSWVWPLHEEVGIHHLPLRVGFVVEKVVLVHILLHVLVSLPVSIIPNAQYSFIRLSRKLISSLQHY